MKFNFLKIACKGTNKQAKNQKIFGIFNRNHYLCSKIIINYEYKNDYFDHYDGREFASECANTSF